MMGFGDSMRLKVCYGVLLIIGILYAGSPFYGVQTHFGQFRRADMDSTSVEQQLDLIQNAGIDMIRDECLWSDVETDSGIYVIPEAVDRYVRSAILRDIDIYMILNYNNTLYAESNGSGVTTVENRQAYARYCQAVVRHFLPLGVKHFEIWNEPNHGVLFWTPQPDANDYTALLQTAYDSIKAVDSSAIVIGCATSPAIGNPAPYIEGLDFIRDVFAAGGGDYMDAVSFHLYQIAYRPEDELISYFNDVISYVDNKPVYLSEFGYPTHSGWPNITLQMQAQYINRMFLICQTLPQIQGVVCYDLKNDGSVAEEPEHNFGLLNFDKSPKPSYLWLKELIQTTNGVLPQSSICMNDAYVSRYTDSLFVGWSFSGTKAIEYFSPASCTREQAISGDTLAYYFTSSDTITVHVTENPSFFIDQTELLAVSEFDLSAEQYLLYQGEQVQISYEACDPSGVSIIADANSIHWQYTGNYGNLENGIFTAAGPEDAMIIASLQGRSDTIGVRVIEDPSCYIVEDFSDTSGFTLSSDYLNMDNSAIELYPENSEFRLKLNYEYGGSGAIAYIKKDILINHHADSIYIDLKTDEKEYDMRLYCKDGIGRGFTLYLKPRPADWTKSWGTLSCPLDILSSAVAPVNVTKLYIKLKPGGTAQAEPYTGSILFDNIKIKKGDIVSLGPVIPTRLELSQNYPNPFNGTTRIKFNLPLSSKVNIDIYNLKGEHIGAVLSSNMDAGEHFIDLNIKDLASGVYIYRLRSNQLTQSRKFIYLK